MHDPLGLPRGAGGEDDHARTALRAQAREQRMQVLLAPKELHPMGVVSVNVDHRLDLGQAAKRCHLAGCLARERHEDGARIDERQHQRDGGRRVLAAISNDASLSHPVHGEFA